MRTISLVLFIAACTAAPVPAAKPDMSDNLTDTGKVSLHVVRSHGLEAVHRPVSLLARLGSLVTHSVRDTGRELALRTPVKPSLARKEGEAYFTSLAREIAGARKSIKVRTYIFDRDDYSLALADFLKVRSNDVETKVMFDGLGTILAERVAAESQPEIEREPLGITTYLLDGSAIKVRNLTNPWFTGDHVKTTIIDERVGYLGGMNIGREYRFDWHDLMVRVEGPVVNELARDFDRKWAHSGSFGDLRLLGP